MTEQSSATSQTASAFYDPDSSSWRTSQLSLLWEVPQSLPRLPKWGTTADGALYERPTPGHLTAARDGGALPLLPTPLTDSEAEQSLDRYGPNLGMVLKDLVSISPRFSVGAAKLDDEHPTLLMGTADSRLTLSSG